MSALLLPICNPLSVEPPRDPNEYIDWLAARYPAVARLRDEHVQYFGDLLSHVLFGDITRYASELARRSHSDVSAQDELRALLRDLDDAIGDAEVGTDLEAKEEIDNVVWVSFVENASGIAGDPEEALRQEIRRFPGLAKALAGYERPPWKGEL